MSLRSVLVVPIEQFFLDVLCKRVRERAASLDLDRQVPEGLVARGFEIDVQTLDVSLRTTLEQRRDHARHGSLLRRRVQGIQQHAARAEAEKEKGR